MAHTTTHPLARVLCLFALALAALPAGSALAAPSQQVSGPSSHDFGMVNVEEGGRYQDMWFQNGSDHEAFVQSAQISGPDASAFWVNNDGCHNQGTLWSGNSCSVQIAYDPSDGGAHHATLTLRTVDSVDLSVNDTAVQLTGSGGVMKVTATPNPLDFGTVDVGATTLRSVTLENTGNQFFQSIVAIPVGGDVGAFRVIEDGCSMLVLAPGIGCKLRLRFAPYAIDNFEARLGIIGQGNPTLVTLRGVGREPAALAEPEDSSVGSAAAERKTAAKKPRKAARVAFNWRRGLPAPYSGRRVDLGEARCQGALACRVSVRAWFVTSAANAAGTRTTPVRRSTWWLASGSPVSVWVPRGLKGSPLRLVADLRTRAAGRPTGVQRMNVRLVNGIRRNGAVVATPAGR
jgi:hypothetical protein